MLSFTPNDYPLPVRHQYLISAVGPRPIAWASTINKSGKVNLAPFSFFNVFSANPATLIFSSNLRGRDAAKKDTLLNIEKTKEVVINIVTIDLVNQMNITSTDYDSKINEFSKAGVTELKSDLVKPPRVKESPIQFECKVTDIITLGKEGGAGNLFVCEIVKIHIHDSVLDASKEIDPNKLQLVARMGKNYYSKAFGEAIFEIDNPFSKQNIGFDRLPDSISKSEYLTGNEIARIAMETEFPTEEEMDSISNSFLTISPAEKYAMAKRLLEQGNVREAFALLMKAEKEDNE